MRFRFAAVVAAALALMPFAASADDAPTYPKPAKPDFSSMQFLVGVWHCSLKSSRRPSASTTVDTWSMDPTGYYLIQDSTIAATPWTPYAVRSRSLYTYDPDAKMWGEMDSSDSGGYSLETSTGWSGNTLVWHNVQATTAPDIASLTDFTVTKVSDTNFSITYGFTTKSGKSNSVDGGCTKT